MNYKSKIKETRSMLNAKMPKEFSVFDPDVWSQVAKTAEIEIELGGVPVQQQRHLITSWAAMNVGVNLAFSLLRREHANHIKSIRDEYDARLSDKDEISTAEKSCFELTKENSLLRALPHISNEKERALVSEELSA